MKESRSSIQGPDKAINEDLTRKCHFLFSELVRGRQLSRWVRSMSTNTKAKSSNVLSFFCQRIYECTAALKVRYPCLLYSKLLIMMLLFMGGIELNPGPNVGEEEDFRLRSQNCRGLTDRNKLFKLLRKLYPPSRTGSSLTSSIACLQETHCLDNFILAHYFKGTAIVDNGERNQRGVCTLIPDNFEVCSSRTSGVGRWTMSVIKAKTSQSLTKYVIVNVYAPNCHREATTFYQDMFQVLDEETQTMTQLNENFEIAIVGDFNVVLNHHSGASNRIGSRIEKDLAKTIKELMVNRNLFEAIPIDPNNSFTWRRGICMSKLDYIFLSSALLSRSSPVQTQWHEFGSNLDHATISVQFKARLGTVRGRSFPKLFKTDIASEQDSQWLRDQIRQHDEQIPNHWNAHQKLDFIKMILRSKALELRQMKKHENSCESVRAEINSIILDAPLDNDKAGQIETLKLKLQELEELEAESLRIKAGVKWREEGEKSTAYFLAKFKARTSGSVMHSLNLGTRIVTGSKDILAVVQQFYGRLYNKIRPPKLGDSVYLDHFFANCPMMEREHQIIMTRPLTLEELKESLSTCKDSAPGLDGIPYSFYKAFSEILLKYVIESWELALRTGHLADSHKRSCITLLPKKGKDLSCIANWRPISLSSCDLKIITKAYANRLKVVLPSILSEAQAAYIPGRDINFNNRLIRIARSFSRKQGLDHCVVSLDAQKAFDSVSHEYLIKVLEAYGFPPDFITVVRVLYENLTSVVQVNGHLSKEFRIANGVKQGDALSCGLFVLAIDPLLRNLNNNAGIEGVSVPIDPMEVVEVKVLSYADDITIVSANTNLQEIFSEYERFSNVSGLVLNADKTEVFNMDQSPILTSRVTYLGKQYDLGRVNRIRLCGMWMAHNEEEDYQLNVLNKIEDMESIVLGWGRRRLTLNGRMILAKTFLMSQIVFPAQIVQIKNKEVKKIEKLIYAFVNGARNLYGPERISRANLKAPRELGGINGIDVESFIQAIAVKQYVKAAKSHRILGLIQRTNEIPVGSVGHKAREALRLNYKEHAAVYSIPDLQQLEDISGLPLTLLISSNTQAAQIAAQDAIESLGTLQQKFHLALNGRARVNKILRAIPRPFSNLIRANQLHQVPAKISWFSNDAIIDADRLPTKTIRLALTGKKYPDLRVNIQRIYKRADWPPPDRSIESEATLANIWEIKNPTLRAVRLKVLYKDVFCNERRHRFGLANSPNCDICGQIESIEHHLFSCHNAARLWSLYQRLSHQNIHSMFDVLMCSKNVAHEIAKTIILKALIQIDRSKDKTDREIIAQCLFFLRIEARVHKKQSATLMRFANELERFS